MTRYSKNPRVTRAGTKQESKYVPIASLPPYRKRHPVMFWGVVVGTAAMVLMVLASLLTAISQTSV